MHDEADCVEGDVADGVGVSVTDSSWAEVADNLGEGVADGLGVEIDDCLGVEIADGMGVGVAISGCLANDDVEAATRVGSDSKAVGSDWPSAVLSASLSGSSMRIRDYIIVVVNLNVVDARHLNFLLNISLRNLV